MRLRPKTGNTGWMSERVEIWEYRYKAEAGCRSGLIFEVKYSTLCMGSGGAGVHTRLWRGSAGTHVLSWRGSAGT